MRIQRIYDPEVWLQVYYPLYYVAKAIRKNIDVGDLDEASRLWISIAVASLLLWSLWLNARSPTGVLFTIVKEALAVNRFPATPKILLDYIFVPLTISVALALYLQNWLDAIVLSALLIRRILLTSRATKGGSNVRANRTSSSMGANHQPSSTSATDPNLKLQPPLRAFASLATTATLSAILITRWKPCHGNFRSVLELDFASAVINLPTARDTVLEVLLNSAPSAQTLHQWRTFLIYRSSVNLHLTFLMAWSFIAHGTSPADLRWLMVNIHISDVIGLLLSHDIDIHPRFTRSVFSRAGSIMVCTALALASIQIAGTILTVRATPIATDKMGITLSQQTAFLGAILSNHWLCLLILTGGRFWQYFSHWTSTKMLLVAEIPTRVSYFGWAGAGGVMNAAVAARLWSIGIATLCACGVLCWMAGDHDCLHTQARSGRRAQESSSTDVETQTSSAEQADPDDKTS